ncbi:hypothetical protein BH11GEM1_BH11GEM1_17430 [soil metagenome]
MSDPKPSSPDLSTLANDYDIVGEVGGSSDARSFMATRKAATGTKRRDDTTGVVITVVTPPEGDEGNALSHLAADTKLLAGTVHRRLLPVIEGRWVGDDAFAVVTQRTNDPSLAQRLATVEKFTTTRVAAILREVNGLLEWAREHNIVHRGVTLERLFLEPKTDRVRVSFSVAPIRRIQQSDAQTDDARTIVKLAMAMLTGVADPTTYDGKTLSDMRPELPERLHEATAALLEDKRVHTHADVASFIALVGMADPLYQGETEAQRIRAEVLEEQRVEREKLAAERAEFERVMMEERATFEKHMADEGAKYEKFKADEQAAYEKFKSDERAAFEKAKASERDRAAKEKAELQRVAEAERAALLARRAELERAVAEQRKELERVATDDRRRIDVLRAELKAAGDLEIERKRDAALEEVTDTESTLDAAEFATPSFVGPMLVPIEAYEFDDDNALMRDDPIVDIPIEDVAPPEQVVLAPTPVLPPIGAPVVTAPRKRWLIPAGIAAVVVLAGASAIAINARQAPAKPAAPVQAPVTKVVAAPAPVVAPLVSIVPLPTLGAAAPVAPVAPAAPSAPATPSVAAPVADSSAAKAPVLSDSAKAALERRRAAAKAEALAAAERRARRIARDSAAKANGTSATDTVPLFRDASPRRRDSTAKRVTIVKP